MNIKHATPRDRTATIVAEMARSTYRYKSLFIFLTIAIYASLSIFTDGPPGIHYYSRILSKDFINANKKSEPDDIIDVKPYTLRDALKTQLIYKSQFGLAVIAPTTSDITLYYPSNTKWKSGCHKLVRAFEALSSTLGDMGLNLNSTHEVIIPISAGDSPVIHMNECVTNDQFPCFGYSSPILQFGSGFNNPVLPGEIIMPMPQADHLGCFQEYSHTEKCLSTTKRKYYDWKWEDLKPQVVWRGTDFTYLGKWRTLRAPDFEKDVGSLDTLGAIEAMKRMYDEFVPRWKGVILTAEAEFDAKNKNEESLPWANIKFSHFMSGGKKTLTSEGSLYRNFESRGIPAVGEFLPLGALSHYKYHIDIGGGGGTTWSGTLDKLALPGLLFHHVTPTKDYFHDALVPFEHYVPIKEDLSDLKEKFEWAEANEEEARRIAEQSTEWVKQWFGTDEGFGASFGKFYAGPLKSVVHAYQHVNDWKLALDSVGMKPIMTCSGVYGQECKQLDESLHYYANQKT